MISENQIKQQKSAISDLKKEVEKAADSEKKERALAYCNGCIDACELALEVLKAEEKDDKSKEEAPAVEEEKPKAKPKAKRSTKKKAAPEPVEAPTPEPVEELATESADDVDLDDLL